MDEQEQELADFRNEDKRNDVTLSQVNKTMTVQEMNEEIAHIRLRRALRSVVS